MITRIAVITAKSLTKVSLTQRMMKNTDPPADGQAHPHEHERADHALRQRPGIDRAVQRRLKMIATMIQPTLSSMIAEARMTWPTVRRMKFISRTTVATILTEAIDSAVPRNSDGDQPLARIGQHRVGQQLAERHAAGERHDDAHSDAETEARPVCRTSLRSVSMPVSSSNSRMPNCEIASIIAFCSGFWETARAEGRAATARTKKARAQPGDQLPHHRRLLEPQHGFAEQAADQHQHHDLRDEQEFGRAFVRLRPRRTPGSRPASASAQRQRRAAAGDAGTWSSLAPPT